MLTAADSSLNSYMGIIPELERVFITIDQSLFLWDYVEGYVLIFILCHSMLTPEQTRNKLFLRTTRRHYPCRCGQSQAGCIRG